MNDPLFMKDVVDAVKAGDAARIGRLLDRDSGLLQARNAEGESLLLIAAYHRRPEIADLLIARGAQPDMFEAAALGRVERVQSLLQEHPDLVHTYSPDGFQPLCLAAYFGHPGVASLLLTLGADVNAPSTNARRVMPLHAAVAGRHTEIARMLVSAAADVNATQAGGWTPLQQAAQHGDVPMLELLLDHGAAVNTRGADGKTALGLALEKNQQQAADVLRARGAAG